MNIFKKIERNDVEAIELWLQETKDKKNLINSTTKHNLTLLLYALQQNRYKIAKLFIQYGANVHAVDANGNNALIWAATLPIQEDREKTIRLLLEKNVSVKNVNKFGTNVIALLSRSVEDEKMIKELILKGAYVDCCYNKNAYYSLFKWVSEKKCTLDIDFILNNGVFLKEENKEKFKAIRIKKILF